jgi:hypothetical protein
VSGPVDLSVDKYMTEFDDIFSTLYAVSRQNLARGEKFSSMDVRWGK